AGRPAPQGAVQRAGGGGHNRRWRAPAPAAHHFPVRGAGPQERHPGGPSPGERGATGRGGPVTVTLEQIVASTGGTPEGAAVGAVRGLLDPGHPDYAALAGTGVVVLAPGAAPPAPAPALLVVPRSLQLDAAY